MSAICGIIHRDRQPVLSETLAQIMTTLKLYGPDGSGRWCEGSAALGHQMLHVTPESLQATVPWQDPVNNQVITAAARLDNRSDLYTALAISPQIGRELSDVQLILQAYRKWGENCPQHLLGDFAFAIWDANQQRLFCARDIMGVCPFYYYVSASRFVFASDVNGILATPGIDKKFYEPMLAAMLQGHDLKFAEKRFTFYDGIVKLPPAHSLILTPTRLETDCYWSPEKVSQLPLKSEVEYIETLQNLLEEAVCCRLRSAFPVGAHLSGGLDSSAVAVLAARQTKNQLFKTFSWAPPLQEKADEHDERSLIQAICKQEKITCEYVSLTAQDVVNIRARDFTTQPTTMLFREQHVQTVANQHNIRLLLSGWGGDEAITFNGRGYFAELFLQGHWLTLWRESKLRSELHGDNIGQWLKGRVLNVLLPDPFLEALRSWRNPPSYRPINQSAYIQPAFAQRNRTCMQSLLRPLFRERPGVRRQQCDLLNHGHLTQRIESWAVSGGQRRLAYSYPLLDKRILEFALGIPVEWFFKNGWKRYLFRSATAGILPDSVRWNKTKAEPALWAKNDAMGEELKQLNQDSVQQRFAAGYQIAQLAQYIDVQQLAKGLDDPKQRDAGFAPALRLALLMGTQSGSI